MKIGITGGGGFIGSYLIRHLTSQSKYELICLRRKVGAFDPRSPHVEWVSGDLCSLRDCVRFVKGLDVIIHLAQSNNPLSSDSNWASDASLNLQSNLNLLQAIKESGACPQLIFASSGGAVYQLPDPRLPLKETDPCGPNSPYGIQKLAVEKYIRLATQLGWVKAVILRISNPYGILLPPERRQGLIGIVVNQALSGMKVQIYSNSEVVRDYLHLDDLMSIFDLIIGQSWPFKLWNVGSGKGYSVDDVIRIVERATQRTLEREMSEYGKSLLPLNPWSVLDSGRAKIELGWEAKVSICDGIGRMLVENSKTTVEKRLSRRVC